MIKQILLLIGVLSPFCSFGQEQFSLKEAIDYGIDHHYQIKSSLEGVRDAALQIKEAKTLGLPQLTGHVGYTYNPIIATQLLPASNFNPEAAAGEVVKFKFGVPWSGQASVNLSQLIFDSSYLIGLRAADTYQKLASIELERTKLEIAGSISKAYYSALVATKRAEVLDVNIATMDTLIYQTRQYFEKGFAEKIEVDRLVVQRNNLIAEKTKLQKLIEVSHQLLKFQMAYPQSTSIVLTQSLDEGEIHATRSEIEIPLDFENRIEYQSLLTNEYLTRLNMERYKKSNLPSVGLSASLGISHSNINFNPFEHWFGTSIISLGLNFPIYDSGKRKISVERQKVALAKIENAKELLKTSFELENQTAITNILNEFETMEVLRTNIDLAKEVHRVAKVKYQQGVGSNLEIVNAETDLKEAQNNFYLSLYDLLISRVDFELAQGTLLNNFK